MTPQELDNMRTEGNRGFMALCNMARELGSKDPFNQLQNNDGSCVGDLICFLEDNPGAIDAIKNWVMHEYDVCDNCGHYCEDQEICQENGCEAEENDDEDADE